MYTYTQYLELMYHDGDVYDYYHNHYYHYHYSHYHDYEYDCYDYYEAGCLPACLPAWLAAWFIGIFRGPLFRAPLIISVYVMF